MIEAGSYTPFVTWICHGGTRFFYQQRDRSR